MVAASAASLSVELGWLTIMACAGVAGFSRIYGAAAGLVLMLAAGVSAIMADAPVILWPLSQSHVLIYFGDALQDRAIGLFRGSLCRKGFLGLGSRETLRFATDAAAFTELVREERIYQKC